MSKIMWDVKDDALHVRVHARSQEQALEALVRADCIHPDGWKQISGQWARRVGSGARWSVLLIYQRVWRAAPPWTEARVQRTFGELAVLAERRSVA